MNFSTKRDFTAYINSPKYRFECAQCKTHYVDKDAFRLHLDLAHKGYICTVGQCQYWSVDEAALEEHIGSHSTQHERGDGTEGTADPRKPRKFGNPPGADFLKSSKHIPLKGIEEDVTPAGTMLPSKGSLPSHQSKRWEEHKDTIISLYMDQQKPLHEVQKLMEERHGFKASIRAYRSRFDRWELHKHNCRRPGSNGSHEINSPRRDHDLHFTINAPTNIRYSSDSTSQSPIPSNLDPTTATGVSETVWDQLEVSLGDGTAQDPDENAGSQQNSLIGAQQGRAVEEHVEVAANDNLGEIRDGSTDPSLAAASSPSFVNVSIEPAVIDAFGKELLDQDFLVTPSNPESLRIAGRGDELFALSGGGGDELFAQRLQETNDRHLSAGRVLDVPRGSFMRGSPLAPEPTEETPTLALPRSVVPGPDRSAVSSFRILPPDTSTDTTQFDAESLLAVQQAAELLDISVDELLQQQRGPSDSESDTWTLHSNSPHLSGNDSEDRQPIGDIHVSGDDEALKDYDLSAHASSLASSAMAPGSPSAKKHKCPYCEAEFTRHHNLESHLLTHSQERPYSCDQCAMRFRRLQDLKRHSKLHIGEKPHTCPACGRKFARGDALTMHTMGPVGCAGGRSSMGSFYGDEGYGSYGHNEEDVDGDVSQQHGAPRVIPDENVQQGGMEVVYCHACARKWYRQPNTDRGCPYCSGHFTEIMDSSAVSAPLPDMVDHNESFEGNDTGHETIAPQLSRIYEPPADSSIFTAENFCLELHLPPPPLPPPRFVPLPLPQRGPLSPPPLMPSPRLLYDGLAVDAQASNQAYNRDQLNQLLKIAKDDPQQRQYAQLLRPPNLARSDPVIQALDDAAMHSHFQPEQEASSMSLDHTDLWTHTREDVKTLTAPTDSGYASLPRDKDPGQGDARGAADGEIEDEASDLETVYSDDRSQASVSRTQRYISEFVDHLCGNMKHDISRHDRGNLEECLPELLQAFALKLGQSSSSRGHSEVMYFVHKHRRAITQCLKNRLQEEEGQDTADTRDGSTSAAGMSLKDKLNLWAQKASDPEAEDEIPHVDKDSHIGLDEEMDELEDEVDLNELYRYQSLIGESSAFDWLVGSLQRQLQLDYPAVDGVMHIKSRILQGLPTPRHISRKRAVPPVQVTFTAPWDPVAFIEEQGYDLEIEYLLGKVITLTGDSPDVQAITCGQYLAQTWPSMGKYILRIVEDTVPRAETPAGTNTARRAYILPDKTRIMASLRDKNLVLEASGTAYAMAELGEQLGWLITALRSSTHDSKITVLCPIVERFQRDEDSTQTFSCHICAVYRGEVPVTAEMHNGECWHRIFRNPVVVCGYPVPRRHELDTGTGLEIPLDILIALTDASGISEFDDRTFIKGHSAMLIPTKQAGGTILWHLLLNEDGSRISYTDCRLEALEHIRPTGIKQARHIVGWVSQAKNNTGSPDANYDIKWSGLGKPRERHAWEKVVISGGDPVGVGASFVIGKKDRGILAGGLGGYASRLKFISKQYVVLYDLDDRRAWLVDGLSALLHLVRASLEHDQKDVFKPYFLYNQGQMKECATTLHGPDAAANVLFSPENCSLRLYTENEDTWDEETEQQKTGAHGLETVKEVVSKRKVTFYCLRDRVLEIFAILEKMIDHLNNVQAESGVGFRLRGTPRNILEGFDFMDVATSNAPIWPHMIKLNICESGRGWTDLLRSIQAITLFGKGFGELIAPSGTSLTSPACGGCGYGISLPTGKDYLGTCVNLVERILTTRGSTETVPWCLADDIYWHTPGPLFDPCQCSSSAKGTKPGSRVQVLLPSTFNPLLWGRSLASPNELQSEGAIMFSHNWRVPFRLGHQPSQEQKTLEPPDSGLGTSIDSSSLRSQLSGSAEDTDTQVSNAADGSSVQSVGTPADTATQLSVSGHAQQPEMGSLNRKRRLVDMVDRVKRKVMKTTSSIEMEEIPVGGENRAP